MIEWGNAANKTQVQCLTRLEDLQLKLRLSKRRTEGLPEFVVLDEPAGLEFARLRKLALAADDEINTKYPRPAEPPDEIPGESDYERGMRMVEYQKDVSDWLDHRHNYRTDPDTAVYALVIVEAVNLLTGHTISLADLAPECFKSTPLQAMLEVWEAPLGGPVSPVETPSTPEPEPTVPVDAPSNGSSDAPPEAASPESTRSSDAGTEPSPPSPPPSSTT